MSKLMATKTLDEERGLTRSAVMGCSHEPMVLGSTRHVHILFDVKFPATRVKASRSASLVLEQTRVAVNYGRGRTQNTR